MRVTNSMLSGRMMLNINKNMRRVDTLYNQLATTKKIIYPSDDPILASRAIKFRGIVSETEQYQRNVSQGLSWMELTEYAFGNVLNIYKSISELSVTGASDQNAYDDRQKISDSINQFLKQLGAEMNITYAGRYVFSGYRTDQPSTYEIAAPDDEFTIKQNYTGSNVERIKSYQKLGITEEPKSYEADILKLAYKDVVDTGANTLKVNMYAPNSTVPIPVTVTPRSLSQHDDAYLPPNASPAQPAIHLISETGELVLNKEAARLLHSNYTLETIYDKNGFEKGELNPRVYFECTERSIVPPAGPVNWNQPGYVMDDHRMQIEFGTNMTIEINSLAKNSFTDKLYSDLSSLVDLLNRVELSDEVLLREHYRGVYKDASGNVDEEAVASAVNDQLTRERQRLTDIIQNKYSNMIGIIQRESSSTSTQRTDLGTRMSRLDLISERLIDDRLNYKKLLSDNEDADIVEVSLFLEEASNIYQASLQVGAGLIQTTLANFIR